MIPLPDLVAHERGREIQPGPAADPRQPTLPGLGESYRERELAVERHRARGVVGLRCVFFVAERSRKGGRA